MSYGKNVSLDEKSIRIIQSIMDEREIGFSRAVNYLISTADYLKTKVESLRKQQEMVRTHEEKPLYE